MYKQIKTPFEQFCNILFDRTKELEILREVWSHLCIDATQKEIDNAIMKHLKEEERDEKPF